MWWSRKPSAPKAATSAPKAGTRYTAPESEASKQAREARLKQSVDRYASGAVAYASKPVRPVNRHTSRPVQPAPVNSHDHTPEEYRPEKPYWPTGGKRVKPTKPLTNEARAYRLLAGARKRAQKKRDACNLSEGHCSLTREWILERLNRGYCEATGIKFDMSRPPRGHSSNRHAPSLDRIDSRKGYTEDNVQVVIWQYNAAKSEYTTKQFIEMARAAVKKYDQGER